MPYFGVPIRNGLPIGLGSQAGFGIAPFDPRDLFSAGEQGAWYDPSDLTTLFTDSAGTTPVTGVEQFVGLMLDKSKGLVLGPELVTNGGPNIASLTNWQFQANASGSLSSGEIAVTLASSSSRAAYQDITTVIGKWYKVTVTARTANGSLTVGAYDTSFVTIQANTQSATGVNQTLSVYFAATATTTRIAVFQSASGSSTAYNVVSASLRELPGNHATSTGTKRPKLAARYNLLTYTEQFDNGAWNKSTWPVTITANAEVAPNGTTTADLMLEQATSNRHGVFNASALTPVNGLSYVYSVYAKAAGRSYLVIDAYTDTNAYTWFNLATGQVETNASGNVATITAAGNGWYRCTVQRTSTASTNQYIGIYAAPSDNTITYAGDITKGIYIWGADLRPASQATGLIGPTYQRVVDAATYDTVGFLPYLEFDGNNDSMSTGSIVPGTDEVQVFAGVRKLSDAVQVFAEHSADYSANNGAWLMWSNTGASNSWYFDSKGTTIAGAKDPALSAAPITSVLTGIGDISAPLAELRKNGVSVVTNTNTQGTGNYLTYPLFIGMRNNASFPFNGWLSSLIVRFGANLSQSQIEATESWVNGKTGAF